MPTSTPWPRAHGSDVGLEGIHHADDIDVENVAEHLLVFRQFGQRADADAGVGDNDIRKALTGDQRAGGLAHGGRITDIGDVCRTTFREFLLQLFQFGATACDQADACTAAGITPRQRSTQSGGGAGDDDRTGGRVGH